MRLYEYKSVDVYLAPPNWYLINLAPSKITLSLAQLYQSKNTVRLSAFKIAFVSPVLRFLTINTKVPLWFRTKERFSPLGDSLIWLKSFKPAKASIGNFLSCSARVLKLISVINAAAISLRIKSPFIFMFLNQVRIL